MNNKKQPSLQAIRRAFGCTIRQLRRAQGLAQDTLALECGVNRSYFGDLERGLNTPTLEMIHKLVAGLGIPISEFCAKYEANLRREMRKKLNED